MPKIRLDDKEVVYGSYVFSNRLIDPLTGNTFAREALDKVKALDAKVSRGNRDPFTRNTKQMLMGSLLDLAERQEKLAILSGARDRDPIVASGYQSGGSIRRPYVPTSEEILGVLGDYPVSTYSLPPVVVTDSKPSSKVPYVPGFSQAMTGEYVYSGRTRPMSKAWDGSRTTYYRPAVPGSSDVLQGKEPYFSGYERPFSLPRDVNVEMGQWNPSATEHVYPGKKEAYSQVQIPVFSYYRPDNNVYGPYSLPEVTITAKASNRGGGSKARSSSPRSSSGSKPSEATGTRPSVSPLEPLPTLPLRPVESINKPSLNLDNLGSTSMASSTSEVLNNPGFTTGDVLQGIAIGSRFLQLLGGAEQVPAYTDMSPIEQASYDPRRQLQVANATMAARARNISSRSSAVRNALENQIAARSMEVQSDILDRYQNMNVQARQNFLRQLQERSRYNANARRFRDESNMQSRDAYRMALTNAFDSLGYFGQALNNRKMAYKNLDLLRVIYPDIFPRIQSILNS